MQPDSYVHSPISQRYAAEQRQAHVVTPSTRNVNELTNSMSAYSLQASQSTQVSRLR